MPDNLAVTDKLHNVEQIALQGISLQFLLN